MSDAVPSKSGLKVLYDLLTPDWRLRDSYIRPGHYVMQWRSWPDTREYSPPPAVVAHLIRWGYVTPLEEGGKRTQWYVLTDAGRTLASNLSAKMVSAL